MIVLGHHVNAKTPAFRTHTSVQKRRHVLQSRPFSRFSFCPAPPARRPRHFRRRPPFLKRLRRRLVRLRRASSGSGDSLTTIWYCVSLAMRRQPPRKPPAHPQIGTFLTARGTRRDTRRRLAEGPGGDRYIEYQARLTAVIPTIGITDGEWYHTVLRQPAE